MISKIVRTNFFYDTINIKSLDLDKLKIDEKSYKNNLIYHSSYVTSNSVKPSHLIINKVDRYIDEYNRNTYLTLPHIDKGKEALKSMENYGKKSKILLDQQVIGQKIMTKNT